MKNFRMFTSLLMFVASIFVGGGFVMAEAVVTPLPEGGASITAGPVVAGEFEPRGSFSKQDGEKASPDLFTQDIDERVTKISPMRTPIDQISRKSGKSSPTKSLEVKYYSVGNRPIIGKTAAAVTVSTTADRFALELVDSSMLDIQDTVRFQGINGFKEDGVTVDTGVDFVGLVVDVDSSGKRVIQPINGGLDQLGYPAIANGTTVVRMGRAGAEFDVQTSIFSNVPRPETQYCQKFMMQIEESTWAAMSSKEAKWNFSDLERDGVEALKIGMEGSFLFGQKRKFTHVINKQLVYTTGGIYWMVGKKIDIGTFANGKTTLKDTDLTTIAKRLFTGEGAGNRRKFALAGKDAMEAFSNMTSETGKTFQRPKVDHWDMTFTSFDTDFGELYFMYCEMLDVQGKSDEVLVLDPEYLSKRLFKAWARTTYDMEKLAVRDTNAVVLTETSCLYLTNKNAHAILKLKKA